MSTPKVVVTGIGAMSAVGNTFAEVKANLHQRQTPSAVRTFEFHELDADCPAYRVRGYEPADVLGKKGLRLMDWSTKLLLGAMEREMKDVLASFGEAEVPGLCVGTAFGSVQSIGDFLSDSLVNGVNNVNPQVFANTVINSPTGNANIRYVLRNLSATVSTGFNAGLDAIIYARDFLQRGYLKAMVVAGLEEVSYYGLLGLKRSGVLSADAAMRPFGSGSKGCVVGEGCALLLLETEESALSRGAGIIAEIAGTGTSFDYDASHGGFSPSADGAIRAATDACAMAGITASDIDFVAASANGNPHGDAAEAAFLRRMFTSTPVAAYKVHTGECYGASPVLNAVCAIADMQERRISGTLDEYETLPGVNLVKQPVADTPCGYCLVSALSCDGNCGAMVLKLRR